MFSVLVVLIFLPFALLVAVLLDLVKLARLLAAIGRLLRGIFRFVFAPINFVFRYRHWMRSFEYRQGQLMRASHGAAATLFAVFIGWPLLALYPGLPMLLAVVVPAAWGLAVFIDGARKSR